VRAAVGAGGPIVRFWPYPVKSMLGEVCEALTLDARGVAGDGLGAVHPCPSIPAVQRPGG